MNILQLKTWNCNVRLFLDIDSKHVNTSPYVAVNCDPNNYVDRSGMVPINTRDLLVAEFGEQREPIYERLDQEFANGERGIVDNQVMLAYRETATEVNQWVNNMIESELKNMYSFVPQPLLHEIQFTYKQEMRGELFSMRGEPMHVPNVGMTKLRYARNFKPSTLQESTAETILEQSGLGRQIFHYEHMWWDLQIRKKMEALGNSGIGGIYEATSWLFVSDEPMELTAAEMAALYNHENYTYSDLFRGTINRRSYNGFWYHRNDAGAYIGRYAEESRGFPLNAQLYQSYRQRHITIYGDEGRSSVTVPFRRFRSLE